MKEIILIKNKQDKIYRIASFLVTEIDFKKHRSKIKQIRENGGDIEPYNEGTKNDWDEKEIIKNWHTSMELIKFTYSNAIAIPKIFDAELKEKAVIVTTVDGK